MHGRLKVKTTAEQQEAKRKEREKKLKLYTGGTTKAFQKRAAGEFDEEALEITSQLLAANPDFYTLWNFRKEIFLKFKEDKNGEDLEGLYKTELSFLEACLRVNPKSYGTWHQRCFVMMTMPNPDWKKELELCNKYLEYDERNFHCWDYRRFVVKKSNVSPEAEFEFTTNKISTNFSNFSSWHYRSKLLPVLHPDPKNWVGIKEEELLPEFELVQNAFFTDPNDQSAWFYHRWLLGRGEKPLSLFAILVCRETQKINVTLSKPCQINNRCSLNVEINGQTVTQPQWCNLGQHPHSQLWSLDLDKSSLPSGQSLNICIKLSNNSHQQSQEVMLKAEESAATWLLPCKQGMRFTSELSGSTTTILEQELEACQQLHELEPDNKWTLLTLVSLMRALDPLSHEAETLTYIDKLLAVDPDRTMYYNDLRSKYIIENSIERELERDQIFNLSGQKLTCLYHTDHMTLLTSLDLSNNCLDSSKQLSFLWCVRTLNLANNNLKDLSGLNSLPYLQDLTISNNNICDIGDVLMLKSCPSLLRLHMAGNPLCETGLEELKSMLPNVQID